MERRILADRASKRVSDTLHARGLTAATVAEATDMTVGDLDACLSGARVFTVPELVAVGGFLHVAPDSLIGVAA